MESALGDTYLFPAAAAATAGFADFLNDANEDKTGNRKKDNLIVWNRQDIKCRCHKQK